MYCRPGVPLGRETLFFKKLLLLIFRKLLIISRPIHQNSYLKLVTLHCRNLCLAPPYTTQVTRNLRTSWVIYFVCWVRVTEMILMHLALITINTGSVLFCHFTPSKLHMIQPSALHPILHVSQQKSVVCDDTGVRGIQWERLTRGDRKLQKDYLYNLKIMKYFYGDR